MKEEGHRGTPKKINPLAANVKVDLIEEISAKLSKEGELNQF